MPVVLVPGAFRGAWMWEAVAQRLLAAGCDPRPVDLSGTVATGVPSMEDWIDDVASCCAPGPASTVVVGHSMGGVVAQAATGRCPAIGHVVLLDSPLIATGQRAVDVSGAAGVEPPPPDTWIPARPVGPEQGFDSPDLAAWVNERLTPTPVGPSLEAVVVDRSVPRTLVFFDRTPDFYPSVSSRRDCDAAGQPYRSIDTHHDGPLLAAEEVSDVILRIIDDVASGVGGDANS